MNRFDDRMQSWRSLIQDAMEDCGDSFENLVSSTLSDEELDKRFDCGYGGENGSPFTLWTKDYVYFPVCYDGSEWAGCAPRNPNGVPTSHWGGG